MKIRHNSPAAKTPLRHQDTAAHIGRYYSNMRPRGKVAAGTSVLLGVSAWILVAQAPVSNESLARLRNLGKAFYANPATRAEAVEQFRQALLMAGNTAREHINYGLALLRAGKTAEGIQQLEAAQKLDASIPHTWFNLGIAYKQQADLDKALAQFQGMERLVPNEPVTHYQIGAKAGL